MINFLGGYILTLFLTCNFHDSWKRYFNVISSINKKWCLNWLISWNFYFNWLTDCCFFRASYLLICSKWSCYGKFSSNFGYSKIWSPSDFRCTAYSLYETEAKIVGYFLRKFNSFKNFSTRLIFHGFLTYNENLFFSFAK